MVTKLVFVILILSGRAVHASEVCEKWFRNAKTISGTNCLLHCASLKTDMATSRCHDSCGSLCKESATAAALFNLSDLYLGLTPEERALVAKEPTQALQAYKLSWEAETICLSLYKKGLTNDESDACRHFIWAALLRRDLGSEFAGKVLTAHENDPQEPSEQKAMDLENNRRGLLVAETLVKKKTTSSKTLIEEFKLALAGNRLVVLRKRPDNRRTP